MDLCDVYRDVNEVFRDDYGVKKVLSPFASLSVVF